MTFETLDKTVYISQVLYRLQEAQASLIKNEANAATIAAHQTLIDRIVTDANDFATSVEPQLGQVAQASYPTQGITPTILQ